ncbi:MAG: hypothetical protein WC570_03475 [Patescibacteria group bacterium]
MKKIILLCAILLMSAGCASTPPKGPDDVESTGGPLTEVEAKAIAEKTCTKGGEALTSGGSYNSNSRTWWFDANLNSTPPGCNPACVVSEATKTAEINWRCTGLLEPENTELTKDETNSDLTPDLNTIILGLFQVKYPENPAGTSVDVTQQTADHARGSVSFAEGMAGGNWLATKIDGNWQLVFDGNGVIPCSLRTDYGFPDEMLTDCA